MTATKDRGIPCYADGTRDIALLEADGWQGPDASLAISLFEYDLAWRDDGEDYKFIVRRRGRNRFGWGAFKKATDLRKQWNWADLEGVADFCGEPLETWLARSLPQQVQDMLIFYGPENVFGSGDHLFEIQESDV